MSGTRRTFLQAAAGSVAGAVLSGGCLGVMRGQGARHRPVGGRLRVAVIGVGGYGRADIQAVCDAGEKLVALCDVDEGLLLGAREQVAQFAAGIRLYKDFRVMLEAEKGLDVVVVATPDHGHAVQAVWALEHGAHVYLEPPLARTLGEAACLRALAERKRLTIQLGVQGCAREEFRRALEVLSSGLIGRVSEIHAWTNRPVWPQGLRRPEGSDPVPPGLDWDLWLASAPSRPFKRKVYHRFNWRGWHDFGTGALGDVGPHLLNLPFRALALGAPELAEADAIEERFPETFAESSRIQFVCVSDRHGRVPLIWYEGGKSPQRDLMPQVTAAFGRVPDVGCLIIGDKGVWFVADETGTRHYLALLGEPRVLDFEKHEACQRIPPLLPRVSGHQHEFFDAVRAGRQPFAGLEHTAPLAECVLVGCAAQRVPGRLAWNSRKGRFENSPEAEALVVPVYRDGWKVEGLSR